MRFFSTLFKRGYILILRYNSGSIHSKQYVSYKRGDFKLPPLKKNYYEFQGWSKIEKDGSEVYNQTSGLNPRKRRRIVLYPIFIRKMVYISYRSNESQGSMHDDILEAGTSAQLTKVGFHRDGYFFLGWSENQGSRTIDYEDEALLDIEEDLDLYAVWYSYKIRYLINRNKESDEKLVYILKGEKHPLLANPFEPLQGYIFLGWDTNKMALSPTYMLGDSVIDLSKNKTVVLYAIWKIQQNMVIFDPSGGIGTMKPISESQVKIKLPVNAYHFNGYYFLGWGETANSKKVYCKDGGTLNLKTLGNTIRLFALWKLTFDYDFFEITEDMTKTQKLAILSQQYSKYNKLIIIKNKEKVQEAKAVIDGIAILRKKVKES